jgi:hypothetical protein
MTRTAERMYQGKKRGRASSKTAVKFIPRAPGCCTCYFHNSLVPGHQSAAFCSLAAVQKNEAGLRYIRADWARKKLIALYPSKAPSRLG